MKLSRRYFLHLASGAATLPAMARMGWAQPYPSRPIRIIVGYAAGNAPDIIARLLGPRLSARLGQPVIVENKPGAGTNIATEAVVRSPPDGHTLLMVSPPNAINATLYDKLSFEFIRDIAPVASIGRDPNVMVVSPSLPATTVPEFIAYAKAHPGRLSFASAGNGTSSHVSAELFKMMTGIDMVHVPYRGGGAALTDLIGGRVQVMFPVATTAMAHIRAGTLRVLAVTTETRSAVLTEIPTMSEFVPGYEASTFHGVGAPKGTPAEIIERLNTEINAALTDPMMKARIAEDGGTVFLGSPADFGNLIAEETEKWGKVVEFSGAKPE